MLGYVKEKAAKPQNFILSLFAFCLIGPLTHFQNQRLEKVEKGFIIDYDVKKSVERPN